MMENRKEIHKEIIWFLAVTFTITYGIGIYISDKGGLGNPLNMATMFVPSLVVFGLYLFKFKKPIFRNGDLGFRFTSWRYWIIVPLLISFLSVLSFLISFLFLPTLFDSATNIREALDSKGFYVVNSGIGFLLVLLVNAFIGAILNLPMYLGEEIGWRAFLFPRLHCIMSTKKAFLLAGFIWALWHAVMIVQGLNYPLVHPLIGIAMMTLFLCPSWDYISIFLYKKQVNFCCWSCSFGT